MTHVTHCLPPKSCRTHALMSRFLPCLVLSRRPLVPQMNVLHLHLSDWSAVRVQVPAYPQLTASLNGQFYSAAQAAYLVKYAQQRGVRIVPEVMTS